MSNQRQRQNKLTGEVHVKEFSAGNGDTVAYLQFSLYPDKPLLYQASYHRGAEMQELTRENAGVAEAELTCLLFAPNAPEQNPAEDWLKGKNYLRKHFAVRSPKSGFREFLQGLHFESAKFSWY